MIMLGMWSSCHIPPPSVVNCRGMVVLCYDLIICRGGAEASPPARAGYGRLI